MLMVEKFSHTRNVSDRTHKHQFGKEVLKEAINTIQCGKVHNYLDFTKQGSDPDDQQHVGHVTSL